MKIKVKLIGRYNTVAGKKSLQLDIKDGDTLRDVVDAFVKRYPETVKDKKFMIVSKNKTFATFETPVVEGDEVILSPPVVSGG